jgi:hypothetical protein
MKIQSTLVTCGVFPAIDPQRLAALSALAAPAESAVLATAVPAGAPSTPKVAAAHRAAAHGTAVAASIRLLIVSRILSPPLADDPP